MAYNYVMDENQQPETSPAWRYVIYARKSTESAEKQVRSIDDQIRDCKALAKELGLTVIGDPIREERSAKIPGKRPKFSDMLKDIRDGKIDGIISWHPDRLARNAVEAGRIIHMLDTGTLKDLKFKSHQFSNDANGKMLLGMLFVFAKHYSDDLQAKVNRGVKGNFSEGKSGGTPKHGYTRDDEGIYRADMSADGQDNFKLIQEAWYMRANGNTEEECATYLNNNGYSRYVKRLGAYEKPYMTKTTMSRMFCDTFYFGILNQAGDAFDLRRLPIPFEPIVDEETFYKVQSFSRQRTRGAGKKKAIFLPLRHIIFCAACNSHKPMTVGRSRDKLGRYLLYYRCVNPTCTRKPSNIRGKVIVEAIANILAEKIDTLPSSAYETYIKDVQAASGTHKAKAREELSRMQAVLRGHNKQRHELSISAAKLTDELAIKALNQDVAALSVDISALENDIERKQKLLAKSELPVLTPEEFEARIRRASAKFKKGDKFQKDIIVREMFLKLEMGNENMASYLLKEPYLSLVESTQVTHGRGDRI